MAALLDFHPAIEPLKLESNDGADTKNTAYSDHGIQLPETLARTRHLWVSKVNTRVGLCEQADVPHTVAGSLTSANLVVSLYTWYW